MHICTYVLALVSLAVAAHSAPTSSNNLYKHDTSFPAQDLNSLGIGRVTAVAFQPSTGLNVKARIHVGQRELAYPSPIFVLDTNGRVVGQYGNQSIAHTTAAGWGLHGMGFDYFGDLWVTDLLDHQIKQLNSTGGIVAAIGTPGVAGSGTDPMQFGNVADVSFSQALDNIEHPAAANFMFVSDGDGGVNNRVSAFENYDPSFPWTAKPQWTLGNTTAGTGKEEFSSPHSVTYHAISSVVIVADRGNNRTRFVQGTFHGPSTMGTAFGEWGADCVGTPWGVRIHQQKDLMFIADGTNQKLTIISTKGVTGWPGGDPPACNVLQRIDIDKQLCEAPHEMAVDEATGDVYLACVGNTHGNLMRFIPV